MGGGDRESLVKGYRLSVIRWENKIKWWIPGHHLNFSFSFFEMDPRKLLL